MLSRRQFVSTATAPLIWSQTAPRKPNVLLIAVDDLNDWTGCLGGNPQSKTPNLDRLAAQGVTFTNAHCAAPLCNPSRAALMFGIRPSTSGVYDNNQPYRRSTLLKDAVSLPQQLRAHGYRALGSGKIYHDNFPDPLSWDDFYPALNRQKPPEAAPPAGTLPLNGIPRTANFDWGPLAGDDPGMSDYKVSEWINAQLARKWTQPTFLACGIHKPHLPWYVPQKYFDMFPLDSIVLPKVKDDDLNDVPPIGLKFAKPDTDHKRVIEFGKWKQAVQGYLASIAFSDAMVGRVLRSLETSPNARDTIVVMWSDHGWHLGEKLHWRKFTLWEEATRNMLLVSAPGVTKPGSRCQRPVSLIDVYPTLAALCGTPQRKELEGASLLPWLRDPKTPRAQPALTTYFKGNHALRDERWRYIRYSDATEELYDHSSDPLEWTNLASKPELAAVKRGFQQWLPKSDAEPSPTSQAN